VAVKKSTGGKNAGGKREFREEKLQVLSDREHLLAKLSLTFGEQEDDGETVSRQKQKAVMETVENAFDQVLKGYATRVRVEFNKDRSFTVQDNGIGLPVSEQTDEHGVVGSGVYYAIGRTKTSSNFSYEHPSVGTNGVGFSSVVLIAARVDAVTWKDGREFRLSFKDGQPGYFDAENGPDDEFTQVDPRVLHESADTRPKAERAGWEEGTRFTVWLNDSVFQSDNPYSDVDAAQRVKRTCALTPGMEATVTSYQELAHGAGEGANLGGTVDEKAGAWTATYKFEGDEGVQTLLEDAAPRKLATDPFHVSASSEVKVKKWNVPIAADLWFTWCDAPSEHVETFNNTVFTRQGGKHYVAFQKALTAAINKRLRSMKKGLSVKDPDVTYEDVAHGLVAVVSTRMPGATYSNQAKDQLDGAPSVSKALTKMMSGPLEEWAMGRDKNVPAVCERVLKAARARLSAQKKVDASLASAKIAKAALPAKLVEAEGAGTGATTFLMVCEGDSAVSGLKRARTLDCALLGVRGKGINALKASTEKVLANGEVKDLINAVGAGFGASFDLDAMRYPGGIVIATDADPDGSHIATLLYVIVDKLFPGLIDAGLLFQVKTPLAVVSVKNGDGQGGVVELPAFTLSEAHDMMRQLADAGLSYSTDYMKGLGESTSERLHQYAFSSEKCWQRVERRDVEETERVLDVIFGGDTEKRKEWIMGLDAGVEVSD
jgi:DNA gyrase subunit B